MKLLEAVQNFKKEKPHLLAGIAAAVVIGVIAVIFVIFSNRGPAPKKHTMSIQAPERTPLVKDAVPYPLYIRFSGSVPV